VEAPEGPPATVTQKLFSDQPDTPRSAVPAKARRVPDDSWGTKTPYLPPYEELRLDGEAGLLPFEAFLGNKEELTHAEAVATRIHKAHFDRELLRLEDGLSPKDYADYKEKWKAYRRSLMNVLKCLYESPQDMELRGSFVTSATTWSESWRSYTRCTKLSLPCWR
jgi:hypothetical protein